MWGEGPRFKRFCEVPRFKRVVLRVLGLSVEGEGPRFKRVG